ncbi:MAG: carbon starvation protein A, partial [Planctomycetes bacterium]|nr:carbon starvation protein A [Planctomycetota bacterium]
SFIEEIGMPGDLAVTLVAMVVVSFALTTLDSATRLLRFNVEEIGSSIAKHKSLRPLGLLIQNRFLATGVACGAIAFFATYEIDGRPAGLALWQLFGSTNQLIAGLALITATVYLRQEGRNFWPLAVPAVIMIAITLFSLSLKIGDFYSQGENLLLALAIGLIGIAIGVGATAIGALRRS